MSWQSYNLIDIAPIGVWMFDGDGNFLESNPAGAALLACGTHRLSGTPICRYVHPEDRELLTAAQRQALQGERADCEPRFIRADGVQIWVHLSLVPVGAGRVVGYGSEVTARRQSQAAHQRQLQAILDVFPGVIGSFDRDLRIRFANREYARLFGYELAEVHGAHMRDLIGPDWYERLQPRFAAVMRGERQAYQRSIPDVQQPGGHKHIQVNLIPDEVNGRVVGMIAVAFDVTDIKAAQISAEVASRAKTDFLANMSHEIRTPLNGVLGFARLGVEESAGSPLLHDFFRRISESGRLLLGVVNDVLDLSKIEAGEMHIESVPVEPRAIVASTVSLFSERARDKNIALLTETGAGVPATCVGDPLRLEQVLVNLVSNAIKFTEKGQVRVLTSCDGAELRFAVCDTGIGIDAEHLVRLFRAFEQADSSIARRFGGTGIGLTITRRLVELMGGTITVHSELGRGSTFEVRLPLRLASANQGVPACVGPRAASA